MQYYDIIIIGTGAGGGTHVVAVREALKYPNVTLQTNCFVERLETSSSGKEVKKYRPPAMAKKYSIPQESSC